MNIPLKVEVKESSLNGKIMIEKLNISNLNKLLNAKSDLLLSYEAVSKNDMYNNEFVKKIYQTEKEQLKKYAELIKFGYAYVKYEKTRKLMNYGRVFPSRSLGLFSFRKQIRGALAYGLYVDIDISNCHPTLLYQIAVSNNIECKYLKKYINDRDKYLNIVMTHYNVSKDQAKELFIMMLYFGSFKRWAKENNIDGEIIKPIEKLKDELKSIGNVLLENNKELSDLLTNKSIITNKKVKNITSSVVSFILQEWECQILEQLYLYCQDKKIVNNNCILCADGIMIPQDKYDDKLLDEFNVLNLNSETLGADTSFSLGDIDCPHGILTN
jgi:hypothetical protein